MFRITLSVWFASLIGLHCAIAAERQSPENWPQFRGPQLDGQSASTDAPTKWTSSSIVWKAELPVSGHSSPSVWGDRVFLSGSKTQGDQVHRHLFCVGLAEGELRWNLEVASGAGEKLHKMNSWATPTCATDGERVVAFFGPGGLHCASIDGVLRWSRELGDFPGGWGIGASPVIVGDLVIQNCDAAGDSYLLAVDKYSGQQVWRTARQTKPRGGWSTPVQIPGGNLILNGEFGIQAYDPKSGAALWSCQSFNGRGTPSPVYGHGQIYVVNGKPGDVYCVRPGGKGDVTETHMAWHTERRGGRDLPSPVLVDDTLVVVSMGGIVTGYDAATGAEKWKQRLGGNFSGSPIVAAGHVYIAGEDGTVFVFKPSDEFQLVAENKIELSMDDEIVRSSLAIAGDRILLRSDKCLYCIGR